MDTEIALTKCAEDGVSNRVKQNVCIRMAVASSRRCYVHPSK
jgi:hypothetical protein